MKKPSKKAGLLKFSLKWGACVVAVVAATFLVQLILGLFFANARVAGESMAETLRPGDRLVVSRNAQVRRFAIVTFASPEDPGHEYIKRVIGLPGDTVMVRKDVLYINGKRVAEPFLKAAFVRRAVALEAAQKGTVGSGPAFTSSFSLPTLKATAAQRVPAGHYFVLGDNRPVSYDSRRFGFIKQSAVVGVVKWRYWPLNRQTLF